jgi:G3E family GTPase
MSEEICAICHENLESDTYTLPECNHMFHTNCIMTWFRSPNSPSRCPLCNNNGINKIRDLDNLHWSERQRAEENYKRVRASSRRKDCPKRILKMIEKLKKLEKQQKDRYKGFKEFKISKQPDLTVNEIQKKYTKFRRGKWRLYRRIRKQKSLIGFQQNVINIIIPVKQEV